MSETHIGRSWHGHRLEDECPCPKAACGLVIADFVRLDCPEHAWTATKTIRQIHYLADCDA